MLGGQARTARRGLEGLGAMQINPLMTVIVAERAAIAEDIAIFVFTAPDGGELPRFSAGAHIDVEVAPGLTRQYSLCNDPEERGRYVIGVLKEPASRGGSAGMHALERGAMIRISAPRNHFELDPSATRSVLFAGGIGVTPLLCMAEHLHRIGAEFEVHYCSRSPSRAGFRARIAASAYAGRVHLHFDDGDPSQKLDIDAALDMPSPEKHIYVCGPSGFMDFVLSAADARGFGGANVHREYFSAANASAEGSTFQVKLSSSGRVIDIPADRTVLETLRDAGVEVMSSCEQGICGACLIGVLEGTPDHRDLFLTADEQLRSDQFLPCCSRSKTPMLILNI